MLSILQQETWNENKLQIMLNLYEKAAKYVMVTFQWPAQASSLFKIG